MNHNEIKKTILNYIAFDNQIDIFKLPTKEYRQYLEFVVERSITSAKLSYNFDINNCDIFRKVTSHRSVIIVTLVEADNNYHPEYAAFVLNSKERYLYTAVALNPDNNKTNLNENNSGKIENTFFYNVTRYDGENNPDLTTQIRILTQKDFLDLIYSHLNQKLN